MKICVLKMNLLLLLGFFILASCNAEERNKSIILAGSTPGGELMKSMLNIKTEKTIDFIRWKLVLSDPGTGKQTFVLDLFFGESQANTLGFTAESEERLHTNGEYNFYQNNSGGVKGEIFHLTGSSLPYGIKLVKLNENLFHFLTADNKLMIGNGGWSYTLNNKIVNPLCSDIPVFTGASDIFNDTSRYVIFEGRTPCQKFAALNHMNVSPDCFKLKWRITLNRDPVTFKPTTYSIRKVVDNVPRDISGNWNIISGPPGFEGALIVQLDYDKPGESIFLLAGDENVLFFLSRENRLFVGNENFSFTLNRRLVDISQQQTL